MPKFVVEERYWTYGYAEVEADSEEDALAKTAGEGTFKYDWEYDTDYLSNDLEYRHAKPSTA